MTGKTAPKQSKKQISAAKLKANQENALKSTGPRTVLGKSVSALNSTKWGMTTTVAVLPTEDRTEYLNFSKGMYFSLVPVSSEEESLTLEMINQSWRLRRCADLEVSIFEQSLPSDETLKQLNKLSLHESRLTRNRERTRAMLREAQKQRQKDQISDEANLLLDGKDFKLEMQLRRMGFKPLDSALAQSIQQQMNIEIDEHNAKVLARRASVDVELQQRLAANQAAQAERKAEEQRELLAYKQHAEQLARELGFVFNPEETNPATPGTSSETPPQ